MKKLLSILAPIIIIVSGVGGLLTETYAVLGTCLVILGIGWSVLDQIKNDKRGQFIDQIIDAQNKLMAQSGIGSAYSEIVKSSFREKGFSSSALPLLKKALEIAPDDMVAAEYYVRIMALNFSMRRWVKGESYGPQNREWRDLFRLSEKGYKKNPDKYAFLDSMGMLLDIAGQHEAARDMFRKSGERRRDPYWHVHLCTSYGMSGQPDLALKELQEAVLGGASGWYVEYHWAAIRRDLGNYDEAIAHVRKAIQLGGRTPILRSIEEECLYACGRLVASALSKVKLAWALLLLNTKRSVRLVVAAHVHLVLMSLFLISRKIWPITSHLPILNRFQRWLLSPIQPEFTIGRELIRKRHFEKAIELFMKCRKIMPLDVDILMNLAACYAFLGKKNEAIVIIDEALKLEPKNEILLYNREQFLSGLEHMGIIFVDGEGDVIERVSMKKT